MPAQKPTVRTVALSIMLLGLPICGILAHKIDILKGPTSIEAAVYVRSPRAIRIMALGQSGLAASIYWTRTVQYFGTQHHNGALRFDLLYPMLTLTTELDPHLSVAYQFGAIFLSQKPPEGAGLPDVAAQFVERGIKENPDVWQLYYHLGYIHFLERKDCAAAGNAFDRGSKVPHAHPWLKVMTAAMAQKCGDIDTAKFFWEKVFESTEDTSIKQNAIMRLRALRIDKEVTMLEDLVQTYKQHRNEIPQNWKQLVDAGVIRGMPLDPTGIPYQLKLDGSIEVYQYDRFPFIQKGLPPGKKSSEFVTPEAAKLKDKYPMNPPTSTSGKK